MLAQRSGSACCWWQAADASCNSVDLVVGVDSCCNSVELHAAGTDACQNSMDLLAAGSMLLEACQIAVDIQAAVGMWRMRAAIQ